MQLTLTERLDSFEEARAARERELTLRILSATVVRALQALHDRRLRSALRRWHSGTFLAAVKERSRARRDRDGLLAFVRHLGEDMAATDGPHGGKPESGGAVCAITFAEKRIPCCLLVRAHRYRLFVCTTVGVSCNI